MALIHYLASADAGSFVIAGMAADLTTGQFSRSGGKIVSPGQYELRFDFTITGITTGIEVRVNVEGGDGAGDALAFTVDGSALMTRYVNVTEFDLDAGDVVAVVEAASQSGTENITWDHAELSIRRIGLEK